jgi:diguanylate cyclase (GGDEF)-like protein
LQRSGDFIARYGGEEFAIVLPNTNSQGAYHVAQKIRQTIKNLKIPNSASLHDTIVTISLGVASIIPSVNLGYEILIQAADRALYWAKNQGRDRVRVYPEQFHELGKVK